MHLSFILFILKKNLFFLLDNFLLFFWYHSYQNIAIVNIQPLFFKLSLNL